MHCFPKTGFAILVIIKPEGRLTPEAVRGYSIERNVPDRTESAIGSFAEAVNVVGQDNHDALQVLPVHGLGTIIHERTPKGIIRVPAQIVDPRPGIAVYGVCPPFRRLHWYAMENVELGTGLTVMFFRERFLVLAPSSVEKRRAAQNRISVCGARFIKMLTQKFTC